jgi:ferredoxin/flavodoxin
MVVFYFSGTGNSRFVAEHFAAAAGADCYSIEEPLDAAALLSQEEVVAFCYPVYGSCVAGPMRSFVQTHQAELQGKRFVILATQLIFSGDGAHALCAHLPGGEANVVYAEHVCMPNNLCNFPLFPVANGEKNARKIRRAKRIIDRAANEIARGVVRRRGFHPISILLSKSQSAYWPALEQQAANDVRVSDDCIHCGLCVRTCPTKNLTMDQNGVQQHARCAVCYRCVNACPKQAITTLIHEKPKQQYHGIS